MVLKKRRRKQWTSRRVKPLKYTNLCPICLLLRSKAHAPSTICKTNTQAPNQANKHRRQANKVHITSICRIRKQASKQTDEEICMDSYVTNVGLDCVYRSIELNYRQHTCQQEKLLKVVQGLVYMDRCKLTQYLILEHDS